MGLLDSLVGAATDAAFGGQQNTQRSPGGVDPQLLIGLIGALMDSAGGLSGLLARLQQAGLGDAAASWVGTGANQPVSPDALGSALGPELMDLITRQLGGSQQEAAGTMADLLPGLIDQLTPQGQVPADNGLGALGALLGGGQRGGTGGLDAGDLMGMLGGLMGRR
ncbi:YidB family protein [Hydrogenophaga pseudoflava]|uniref:YidB family protein n=1 Tax=Hydrogenophaga pseudoflava TaxID=47421 RepID=UPI0027E4AE5E|nr:YidB family protein [Hydrogenophaga pseudoflava]MDQ7746939.1 YidB family protein [Hydrogenophaga pseudoflava]